MENLKKQLVAEGNEEKNKEASKQKSFGETKINRLEKERVEELERIISRIDENEGLDEDERIKIRAERMTAFLKSATEEEKDLADEKMAEIIFKKMEEEAEEENIARVQILEIGMRSGNKLEEEQIVDLMKVADRADKFETKEVKTLFKDVPVEYKTVILEQWMMRDKVEATKKAIQDDPTIPVTYKVRDMLDAAGEKEFTAKYAAVFQGEEKEANVEDKKGAKQKTPIDFEKVESLGETEAIEMMQDKEGISRVAKNLKKFNNLGYETAKKLVSSGKKKEIASNIDSFSSDYHKDISIKIIEHGGVEFVVKNHKKFVTLDREIEIPEYPEGTTLDGLIEIFEWPGELGRMETIKALHGFKELSFEKHAMRIIKAQKKNTKSFLNAARSAHGDNFQEEIINQLVRQAEKRAVV